MQIERLETRTHLTGIKLIDRTQIDSQLVSGDVIFYTHRTPTQKQPERVRLYRFRISDQSTTLLPSPDGPAWRAINELKIGATGAYFTGKTGDITAVFFADRTSETVKAVSTRKMRINVPQVAPTRDGGVYFNAYVGGEFIDREMYFHDGETLTQIGDLVPGDDTHAWDAPSVSPQGKAYFVDGFTRTIYVSAPGYRTPRAVHTGVGGISILGFVGGEMLFSDTGNEKAYLTGKMRGTRQLAGDYSTRLNEARMLPFGTGEVAIVATSASRGRELFRVDTAADEVVPLPEIVPGADDGFDYLATHFSPSGNPGLVASFQRDGTYFSRHVSRNGVEEAEWGWFQDAAEIDGNAYIVDADGALYAADGLGKKGLVIAQDWVTQVDVSAGRIIFRDADGLFLISPDTLLTPVSSYQDPS